MNDIPTDDARLDNTEAQMRRALGLTGDTSVRSTPHQSTIGGNGSYPQRRQFVRDGDVPVTIVRHHHPDNESTNQLDAARQAIRTQAAARERAERLLEEAHQTVRQLQTTVAHERLANDEAIGRAAIERRTVEHALESVRAELSAEKIAHERAEQALCDARSTIGNLTEKLHGAQQALTTMKAEWEAERGKAVEAARTSLSESLADGPANGDQPVQTVRRPFGRPRKMTVVETVEKPAKAAGRASRWLETTGEEKVPKKVVGRQEKSQKPVKWWLGER